LLMIILVSLRCSFYKIKVKHKRSQEVLEKGTKRV
jgi:hypothetical protein